MKFNEARKTQVNVSLTYIKVKRYIIKVFKCILNKNIDTVGKV